MLNRTTASLETACEAGFHGGMHQWFGIMVRDEVTQEMVANRSSALPRSVSYAMLEVHWFVKRRGECYRIDAEELVSGDAMMS